MNNSSPLCGTELIMFGKFFNEHIFGYAGVAICIAGVVVNSFNILVFTRKNMISAINVILIALAVVDLILLLIWLPFIWYEYATKHSFKDMHSYMWVLLRKWHYKYVNTYLRAISVVLSILLAVSRYVAVVYPHKSHRMCSLKATYIVGVSSCCVCLFLCMEVFFNHQIKPFVAALNEFGELSTNPSTGVNTTLYHVVVQKFRGNEFIYSLLYIPCSVMNLTPAVVLTVLTLRLIYALMETKKCRQELTSRVENAKLIETEEQTNRTTRMLIAVLIMFLIVEVPYAILHFLSVILDYAFVRDCYAPLYNVLYTLMLIDSASNFVVYYAMCQQFRITFKAMFDCSKIFCKNVTVDHKPECSKTEIIDLQDELSMSSGT